MTNIQTAYEEDFYTWTQDQAKAIRALPRTIAGHTIDLDHIAEEIEDLGKSDRRAVESLLEQVFAHILKLIFFPNPESRNGWRDETRQFQRRAKKTFSPGMRQHLNIDAIWQDGKQQALDWFSDNKIQIRPLLGNSPISLDEALAHPFNLDQVIQKISDTVANLPVSLTR